MASSIPFTSLLGIYLAVINLTTFWLFGRDKAAARKEKRRTPNKVLLGCAAAGGSAGALLGMLVFHHKTRKWYYVIPVPALLILHISLLILLWQHSC